MTTQSPADYFSLQDFSLQMDGDRGLTPAEKAFLEKYLGLEVPDAPVASEPACAKAPAAEAAPTVRPDAAPASGGNALLARQGADPIPEPHPRGAPQPAAAQPVFGARTVAATAAPAHALFVAQEPAHGDPDDADQTPQARCGGDQADERSGRANEEERLDAFLHSRDELQMVAFFLGTQEYIVPTVTVQEVIRYVDPVRLPVAAPFVPGVISLRGTITPLVSLRELLGLEAGPGHPDKFIIVCRRRGLQIGLLIERVHTMYRVRQEDIAWSGEAGCALGPEIVSGMLRLQERLVGIISVDRILDELL